MAALGDAMQQSIEMTVRRLRKVGSPTERKDWLVILSTLIPLPNEAIEEFQRQGRIHGVDWLVRVAGAFLTEIAAGNTYRDPQGVLRLVKPPSDGALKDVMEA